MSYFKYFNLLEPPFSIAPNPRYFFNSARHREALEHLKYGVSETGGFLLLTGEVGTGKTTLCRCLLAELPEDVDIALILNPRLNAVELLATICDEFRISYPENTDSLKVLVDGLNEYLLSAHVQGRRTVLIIDEAQNLSFEVLEQIRLLTNLETNRVKLLQIMLVGQPELTRLLNRKDLRQLTQRITCRYHLESLSFQGTKDYIQHRVVVAGGKAMKLFSLSAVRKIHRLTGGVPRLINLLCDRALNTACLEHRQRVEPDIVNNAARQVGPALGAPWYLRPAYWISGFAVMVAAGLLALYISGIWVFSPLTSADTIPDQAYNSVADQGGKQTGSARFEVSGLDKPVNSSRVGGPSPFGALPTDESQKALATIIDNNRLAKVEIPSRQSPPVTAIVVEASRDRPQFTKLIGELDLSFQAAFDQLLAQWHTGELDDIKNNCDSVRKLGLRCFAKRSSLYYLTRLNRPAILEVSVEGGSTRFITLVGLQNDKLTFDLGDRRLTYLLNEVRSFWNGRYTLLWKPPSQREYLLTPGQTSTSVRWLRQQLMEPGEVASAKKTPYADYLYDDELKSRVVTFQMMHGLNPDGIVGPHTLMHLNTDLGIPGIPLLNYGSNGPEVGEKDEATGNT